ncbi:hypothetical protein FAIPA1_80110 [Frankia sp. AiPs1]
MPDVTDVTVMTFDMLRRENLMHTNYATLMIYNSW